MIPVITFLLSLTGLIFLSFLFYQTRLNSQTHHLKKHRQQKAGFVDLLNYAALVDDGVIIGKNGSFMAAWLYSGEDHANSTDKAREMVSFRINQALSAMGSGWMVHVDAIRRAAPAIANEDVRTFLIPYL